MQIKVEIENGRSLKLRQTQQVNVFAFALPSTLFNTKCEAFGPLPDPVLGLREGQEQGEEGGKGVERK
jgi:hypothetical protein